MHRPRSHRNSRRDDSRPKPLEIRGRCSNVRSLIDFYNTRAFAEKKAPQKTGIDETLPANKVKSLVTDFNRRETFSTAATAHSGHATAAGSRSRSRARQIQKDARDMQTRQFGKPGYASPPPKIRHNIDEITVSAGDKREMTYKRVSEPLRTVKVWKPDFETIMGDTERLDVGDSSSTFNPTIRSPKSRTFSKQRKSHHNGRGRRSQEDSSDYPGDPVKHWVADRNSQNDSRNYRERGSLSPWDKPPEKPTSPPNAPVILDTKTHGARTSPYKSRSREPKDQPLGKKYDQSNIIKDPSEPLVKHTFGDSLKGTLMSVFGKNVKSDVGVIKDRKPRRSRPKVSEFIDTIERGLPVYPVLRIPNVDGGRSQRSSDSWSKTNGTNAQVQDGKRNFSNKPSNNYFEHLSLDRGRPQAVQTLLDKHHEEMPGEWPDSRDGTEHFAQLNRRPRTFKEIAQERRDQRLKAPKTPQTPEERLEVAPLRVRKTKSKDEVKRVERSPQRRKSMPKLSSRRPQLRSMASHETFTSFEDPHLPDSDSDGSLNKGRKSTELPKKQLEVPTRPETQPSSAESEPYKPMRSPTLMREMAPPKLSIRKRRSPDKSETRPNTARSNRRSNSNRTAISTEHNRPRMKLRGDDDWMRESQRCKDKSRSDLDGLTSDASSKISKGIQNKAKSSSSHETTPSSQISSRAVTSSKTYKKQSKNITQNSSNVGELEDDLQQKTYSEYMNARAMKSSDRDRDSKVGFSQYTQHFPAVKHFSDNDERGTIIDGALEDSSRRNKDRDSKPDTRSRKEMIEEARYGQDRGRAKRRQHRD